MDLLAFFLWSTTLAQTENMSPEQVQAALNADMHGFTERVSTASLLPGGSPDPLALNNAIARALDLPNPPRSTPSGPAVISVSRLQHKIPKQAREAYDRATKLSKEKKHSEAARELQRAVEIDPAYSDAHNNLGVQYFVQGRVIEAESEFQRAAELDAAAISPHVNLANIAAMKRDYSTAEQEARRVISLTGAHPEAERILRFIAAQPKPQPKQ